MSKSVFLILAIFCILGGTAAAVDAQQPDISCPDEIGEHSHTKLLEYAALAERAYDIPTGRGTARSASDWTEDCENDVPAQVEDWDVHDLPEQYIHRAAHKLGKLDSEGRYYDVYTAVGTGKKVIVCSDSDPLRSLAGTVQYAWRNDELALLTEIVLVSSEAFTDIEEIRAVELRSDNAQPSRLFGIQGTDVISLWGLETSIPRPRQVNTTIRQLMGESCIFDLMPEVAVEFFTDAFCTQEGRSDLMGPESLVPSGSRPQVDAVIVGHSLGGAVAQHVASQRDFQRDIVGECGGGTLRAYSFNSIGLDDAAPDYRRDGIVSVRIAGEFLEEQAEGFGTSQIGHIYRYGLPLPEEHLEDQRFERHGIDEVQRQIRRCRCGSGLRYQYTPAAGR